MTSTVTFPPIRLPSSHGEILIKLHPFESVACHRLILALDEEVTRLYPDAADFPYEGAEGGWINGAPDVNPVPSLNPNTGDDPVFEVRQNLGGEKKELFFLVAFPVQEETTMKSHEEEEKAAVGCVGLRMLPYFPLHRTSDKMTKLAELNGVADISLEEIRQANINHPTTEVKRMYVVPDWRGGGRRDSEAPPASSVESVAVLLLQTAEQFARDHMGAKRLVLETGMRQVAAMRLYARNGWTRRDEFGEYAGAGERMGGLSRCFEKEV